MSISKILIVDDRKFDRILYKEYLGSENYSFAELDCGKEIIATIDSFKPEIILLDWQMPMVCGKETLKAIRNNPIYNHIPIVVITGVTDPKELSSILTYENVDLLNKPVNPIELNTRVKNTLKYSKCLMSSAIP